MSFLNVTLPRFVLHLGADVREGEGPRVFALCYMLFMLMLTAYVLKPVREELILVEGGSQYKSYATAMQAIVLLLLVPIYGYVSRRCAAKPFMLAIAALCVLVFLIFVVAGMAGVPVGMPFYIWYGTYGLLMVAQFWAYCSDYYDQQAGKRLFGIIAFGATSGALVGAIISSILDAELNAYYLLLVASLLLILATLPVWFLSPVSVRKPELKPADGGMKLFNGFRLIASSKFLFYLAVFTLLFNWLNSLGEYLVSVIVEYYYELELDAGDMAVSKNAYVRSFYSDYYLLINILGTVIQFFVVSRFIGFFGVRLALVIVPLLTFLGYTFIAFVPVLLVFKCVKVLENSLDYSLLSTSKQILYLPTNREARYEARAVIETIFMRLGDVLQGLTVFYFIGVLSLQPRSLLWFLIFTSLVLLAVVWMLGLEYRKLLTGQSNK